MVGAAHSGDHPHERDGELAARAHAWHGRAPSASCKSNMCSRSEIDAQSVIASLESRPVAVPRWLATPPLRDGPPANDCLLLTRAWDTYMGALGKCAVTQASSRPLSCRVQQKRRVSRAARRTEVGISRGRRCCSPSHHLPTRDGGIPLLAHAWRGRAPFVRCRANMCEAGALRSTADRVPPGEMTGCCPAGPRDPARKTRAAY